MAVRFDAFTDGLFRTVSFAAAGALTISMWIYLVVDTNAIATPAMSGDSGSGNAGPWLQTDADGTTLRARNADGSASLGGLTMSVATWYRVAIAASGTNSSFYTGTFGGTLTVASGTLSRPTTADSLYFGSYFNISDLTNCRLANIKVWTAQLAQAEIEADLAQYAPVRTTNLIGWYPEIGAETTDRSGAGNNLTAGSTATATEDGPPIPWAVIAQPPNRCRLTRSANF